MADPAAPTPRASRSTLETVLGWAVVAGAGVNAIFAFSFATAWVRKGAPFVPTARRKIDAIFHPTDGLLRSLSPAKRSATHVVDLGSGSGSLVRAAVRQGGFGLATGFELNPALVVLSRLQSLGSARETFQLANLWSADLTDVGVVVVYGVPSLMDELALKLRRECPAALVVSNSFEIPRLRPLERVFVDAGLQAASLDDSSYVYLYQVPAFAGRRVGARAVVARRRRLRQRSRGSRAVDDARRDGRGRYRSRPTADHARRPHRADATKGRSRIDRCRRRHPRLSSDASEPQKPSPSPHPGV